MFIYIYIYIYIYIERERFSVYQCYLTIIDYNIMFCFYSYDLHLFIFINFSKNISMLLSFLYVFFYKSM